MGFARQGDRSQHLAPLGRDKATQVRKRAAHTNKIIGQHVIGSRHDRTVELRLPCQPGKPVCTRVSHHVDLNDTRIDRPVQPFTQFVGQHFRDGVDTLIFKRVGANQYRMMSRQHAAKRFNLLRVDRVAHQMHGGDGIAAFSRPVSRMLFDGSFAGMNQHVWKSIPGRSWRFHRREFYHAPDKGFEDDDEST